MRKLSLLLLLLVFVFTVSACGNSAKTGVSSEDSQYTMSHATWLPLEGGDSEESAIANSSLIVKGEVISQDVELLGPKGGEIVFTHSKFKVSEVYSINVDEVESIAADDLNKNSLIVDVRQTGGSMDGVTTSQIEDAPLLEVGTTYVLLLDKKDDGFYNLVGGRLGTAIIKSGGIQFVNEESRQIFKELGGEKLSNLDDVLENIIEKENLGDEILVNEEGYSPKELVKEAAQE
jgi:hypothetical protein